MPAITIFDDSRGAARNRPTSLPAEARSLSRMLRLLESPQTAADALSQSLEALPTPVDASHAAALHRVKQQVLQSISELKDVGWHTLTKNYAEFHMALAVESVLQDPSAFVVTNKKENNVGQSAIQNTSAVPMMMAATCTAEQDDEGHEGTSGDETLGCTCPKKSNKQNGRSKEREISSPSLSSLETLADNNNHDKQTPATTTESAARQVAVVSDNSSMEGTGFDEEEEQTTICSVAEDLEINVDHERVEDELTRTRAVRYLWATILESLHLQVASRTTRVWGKKKIYEVYQFSKPIREIASKDLSSIRQRLLAESENIFAFLRGASESRVYTTMQPLVGSDCNTQALYVQITLGKPIDLHDERNRSVSGEKKKKAGGEFVAMLVPGSRLFTLTASRAPSRSRYAPYILTVLESVLTETVTNVDATRQAAKKIDVDDLATKRVGDLSGTEPGEILRAARALVFGEAVGRFACMAAKDQSNPISDLRTATTANLLLHPTTNVDVSTRLGNSGLVKTAAKVSAETGGAAHLVAANSHGDSLLVDHTGKEKKSLKRDREQALGRPGDCPSLQRLSWKWAGKTAAASACWLNHDDDNELDYEHLPKTEFKCAVVMKGENVMQGLQALMDAGLVEGPLPDFLRDAPSMGGTIRVNHGSFAAGKGAFEEV